MRKTFIAALAAGVMATAGSVMLAGPAQAESVPVFSVPYSSTLYVLGEGTIEALSYEDWQAAGFPAPTLAPNTEYGSYPWSPVIYAVTPFADDALINALTPDEWARAGWPAPQVTAQIPGTIVAKFASSDELFAANVQSPDVHKLTFAEWGQLGYLAPEFLNDQGFYQLAWVDVPGIAYQDLQEGSAVEISFEAWAAYDYPTPAKVNRIYGDQFLLQGNGDIVYDGPTLADYTLSYAEWQAAGFPTPVAPS
ncbi:hypothetical protein [Nakamurella deserti]|uniref:hypothetical protein n=1 Tax=Nakamurella deserti TaxID=2164074 RepID=UPI0013001B41|nr:hypothetical protein [Nakamurella deserti]